MAPKEEKVEIANTLAYATGLLVGDMWLQRNSNQTADSIAIETFREAWAAKLHVKKNNSHISGEWEHGFDRAPAATLPKNAMAAHAAGRTMKRLATEMEVS